MSGFRKCLTPAVCAIVGALLVAVPASAAGPAGASGPTTASSLTTLSTASRALLAQPAARLEQAQTSGNGSEPFLKTKKGAATLILVGAGFGYALYSKVHDRVMSQVR